MRGWRWMWIVLLALSLGAVVVQAADTGTISGLVVDREGEPVADATVTIAGDQLPSGRSVVSGANGLYQFEYLIPGEYTIQIEKAGIAADHGAPPWSKSAATRGRCRPRTDDSGSAHRHRHRAGRRCAVDGGELQLQERHAQQPAARPHLPRAVSADSRRRRQSQPDRTVGWRQPSGQHVPDRRRQHHEPPLRISQHRGERARYQ